MAGVKSEHNVASPFLDMTGDDSDSENLVPIIDTVKQLIKDVKKYKTFTLLLHLNALKQFIELWEKYKRIPKICAPKMKASHTVAMSIGKGPYMACKICTLYKYVKRFQTLPLVSSGKHHAHPSLLNHEQIMQAIRRYLTALADGEIMPLLLMKQVNAVIIPSLGLDLGGQKISKPTARQWLATLDGHEHEDVVAYWKEFLQNFAPNERLRCTYRNNDLEPIEPVLGPGERLHIPVMHDECIIWANELHCCQGYAIHVSGFIVEQSGWLALSENEQLENEAIPADQHLESINGQEIIYPGKDHNGFWTGEHLIEQVKKMIPLFEHKFPNAVAEFFDQSLAYGAFAKDALNAKEMNVRPGGKQRIMHDTYILMDNPNTELCGKLQAMIFSKDLPPEDLNFEF
ncbi:hypothetical protein BS17DRAFT_765486 [Gyrodon lividus]|nr:hypothetical protein BS17DRAFT_765486 [Gyrodon lividus]